jgi:putative lipoic acid-binding regulatory protein
MAEQSHPLNEIQRRMIILPGNNCKLTLEYPCLWKYKVIGYNEESIRKAVEEVITEEVYTISLSNMSTTGKYLCFNIETTVHDENHRVTTYEALKKHSDIKIVL